MRECNSTVPPPPSPRCSCLQVIQVVFNEIHNLIRIQINNNLCDVNRISTISDISTDGAIAVVVRVQLIRTILFGGTGPLKFANINNYIN